MRGNISIHFSINMSRMSHESGCTKKLTNFINMQGCIRIKEPAFQEPVFFSVISYILEQELS